MLSQQQLNSGRYKLVDGIAYKLCSGSAHEEPEWLPATPKYYYFRKTGPTTGRPSSQCRLCHVWDKVKNPGSHHGFVALAIARPFYIEAVNRVGIAELSRRSGLSTHHLQSIYSRPNKKFVRKISLRKVMLELVSMQRKNEYIDNPRVRWQTDRRNNGSLGTCGGCGGILRNITTGCKVCYDRHYSLFRNKKITKKQWQQIKVRFSIDTSDMIMGIRPK